MTRALNGIRKFLRDTGGTSAVEFAIVGNVFILFLFVITYVGFMFWTNASLDYAVQHGIRLAAIDNSVTQSDVASTVNHYLSSMGLGSATVNYSVSNGTGTNIASVQATLTKHYDVPLLSTISITYSSSAAVPQP